MSVTKTALKAAKAALDRQNYDEAIEQAKKVLAVDPNNYHAYVCTAENCSNSIAEIYGLSKGRFS